MNTTAATATTRRRRLPVGVLALGFAAASTLGVAAPAMASPAKPRTVESSARSRSAESSSRPRSAESSSRPRSQSSEKPDVTNSSPSKVGPNATLPPADKSQDFDPEAKAPTTKPCRFACGGIDTDGDLTYDPCDLVDCESEPETPEPGDGAENPIPTTTPAEPGKPKPSNPHPAGVDPSVPGQPTFTG